MNRLSSRKWGMERKSTETDARGESPLSGRSRRSLFAVMMSSSRSVDNSVSDAEDEESFRPRERSGSKSMNRMRSGKLIQSRDRVLAEFTEMGSVTVYKLQEDGTVARTIVEMPFTRMVMVSRTNSAQAEEVGSRQRSNSIALPRKSSEQNLFLDGQSDREKRDAACFRYVFCCQ